MSAPPKAGIPLPLIPSATSSRAASRRSRADDLHVRGRDPVGGGARLPRRRLLRPISRPGHVPAEGRAVFQRAPWTIIAPGLFLALTVLAMNILGDGLRDRLDPRLARTTRVTS